MEIPNTLRRFWEWLGGTNRTSDIVPTNFDNLQAVPVIPVYQFGGDDGNKAPRLYPPVNDDGFQRTKSSMLAPDVFSMEECPAGTGTAVGFNGYYWTGSILKPAAATITLGAVTIPATTNDVVIPIGGDNEQTLTAGVASCWVTCIRYGQATYVDAS